MSINLLDLNDDVFFEILSYFNFTELAVLRRVSRRFNDLVLSIFNAEKVVTISSLQKVLSRHRFRYVKATPLTKNQKLKFYGKYCPQVKAAAFGGPLPSNALSTALFLKNKFENLRELSLTFCQGTVTDENIEAFGEHLPQTRILKLSHMQVTDYGLIPLFIKLPNLSTIILEHLNVRGECFAHLPPNVNSVTLIACKLITRSIMIMFQSHSKTLTAIVARPVPSFISGEIFCFEASRCFENLKTLELTADDHMTYSVLQTCHGMEKLCIKVNVMGGPIHRYSETFTRLKEFSLDVRNAKDHDVSSLLSRMPLLENLRLVAYCNMEWEVILHTISTMKSLQRIVIIGNRTGHAVNGVPWNDFFVALPRLIYLYLEYVTKEDCDQMIEYFENNARPKPLAIHLRYLQPFPTTYSFSSKNVKISLE